MNILCIQKRDYKKRQGIRF